MRIASALVLAACGLSSSAVADELIVTGLSGIVQTIDLDTGEVGDLGACTGSVNAMAVADGVLYLGGFFGDVYKFDLATNQVVDSFLIPGAAHAMAWDGARLLIANTDSTIDLVGVAIETLNEQAHLFGQAWVKRYEVAPLAPGAGELCGHLNLVFPRNYAAQ